MNEINEFWPRTIMGIGALLSGSLLLSLILQHKKKFSDKPLIELDNKDEDQKK